MLHARRFKDPVRGFAWPPTREDLELIEVVDAQTLRPVILQGDSSEASEATKPAEAAGATRSAGATGAIRLAGATRPVSQDLLKPVTPVLCNTGGTYAVDPEQTVPLPLSVVARRLARRVRIDPSWLIATGGALAIALSAYLSLWGSPSRAGAGAELEPVAPASQISPSYALPAAPFPGVEMTWSPPAANASSHPPVERPRSNGSPAVSPRLRSTRPAPAPAQQVTALRADAPHGRPVSAVATAATAAAAAAGATGTSRNEKLNEKQRPAQPRLLDTVGTLPVASTAASIPTMPLGPAAEPPSSVRVPVTPVSAPAVASPAPPGAPPEPGQPGQVGQPGKMGQTGQTQQQIVATLHQYERAYEQLDAKAVRAVWPSVDTRALARAFHDLKSQTLVFDRCDVDVARIQAVAACRGRATYETRAGEQASRTEPREWTFTLQKHDDAWRIVSASAR
jgi:hypothetical protein